jgi:hypothetical protein
VTLEQLGNLGEFVAAIAVVVSIFYLAMQMRQNTASVRAAAYQAWLAAKQELYSYTRDPDFSRIIGPALADSRNLNEETWVTFGLWCQSWMNIGQAVNLLYEKRAIDHSTWQIELRVIAAGFQYPGFRQWWDAGGKTQITPEFAQLIESIDLSGHRLFNWNKDEGFFPEKDFLGEEDQRTG